MRCLPHGCYSLWVALLCTAGWTASLMQDGCDFARVEGPVVAELTTLGELPPPWLEFGIGAFRAPSQESLAEVSASTENTNTNTTNNLQWQFEHWYDNLLEGEENCQLFQVETMEKFMDNAWTTARTFAFLALVLGGGGTLFLWASTFFVFSRGTWRWTGYLILIGSLCNSMTFLWYLTSICSWNTCSMFWGSKTNILASTLWFLGGLFIVCRYPIPLSQRMQKLGQEEPSADGVFVSPSPPSSADTKDDDQFIPTVNVLSVSNGGGDAMPEKDFIDAEMEDDHDEIVIAARQLV
mmetsp:Transcript_41066/g.98984  ORF Transcript_41066/g.98984 Transcript_41066/m.98984 type:complete len:295 (+) Transcript_41066:314-1198(+)|eukprot:CAMPEP_0113630032 /NCGR_PEP_ID=MMETSP0017_2-20120614/15597_1 /TAXON_ID=2856 /ORGANISM="Cylindrotheca closterium" /LENGTH=294 /DNA_ID=CAMNT_0000540467 /DNA_START=205 /DNA_END=1089 /DNA_ORIENTATION=+ /assembly_acc=CAM_ASM_000147